jgi:hypothetical protein
MGASPWVGSGHTPVPPTLRGLNNPTKRQDQFGPFGADDNSRIVSVCLPTVGFTHARRTNRGPRLFVLFPFGGQGPAYPALMSRLRRLVLTEKQILRFALHHAVRGLAQNDNHARRPRNG